jgi:mannose-6-phosphate isomerase-like protein (cupin superfamily)
MNKVNLREKFGLFSEHWSPKVVGQVADTQIKVVKVKGEFPWHLHENEDELFLIVRGRIVLEFRDRSVPLEEGEFLIVPKGIEHRPVAAEEAHVVLIEPATTLNTGNTRNERTVDQPEWI